MDMKKIQSLSDDMLDAVSGGAGGGTSWKDFLFMQVKSKMADMILSSNEEDKAIVRSIDKSLDATMAAGAKIPEQVETIRSHWTAVQRGQVRSETIKNTMDQLLEKIGNTAANFR